MGEGLTARAGHSGENLAALQQVVLGLFDLCRMSVSMRPDSRLPGSGTISVPFPSSLSTTAGETLHLRGVSGLSAHQYCL